MFVDFYIKLKISIFTNQPKILLKIDLKLKINFVNYDSFWCL